MSAVQPLRIASWAILTAQSGIFLRLYSAASRSWSIFSRSRSISERRIGIRSSWRSSSAKGLLIAHEENLGRSQGLIDEPLPRVAPAPPSIGGHSHKVHLAPQAP